MSDGGGNDTLLELFIEEVRSNVQTLGEGLVALEQDPANATLIEPLMRAAHSIKGAARVVDVVSTSSETGLVAWLCGSRMVGSPLPASSPEQAEATTAMAASIDRMRIRAGTIS